MLIKRKATHYHYCNIDASAFKVSSKSHLEATVLRSKDSRQRYGWAVQEPDAGPLEVKSGLDWVPVFHAK